MNIKPESFSDFLKRFSATIQPQLLFREGDDFSQWQARFRQAMDGLRGPLPERVPLEVEELETVQEETHSRTTLRIKVSEYSRLIAYLMVPADLEPGEKRPGLIVSHGHARYGIDSMAGLKGIDCAEALERAYALSAVNDGYVVLAPAWWGWAGRDGHWDENRNNDKCNLIQMAASMYGISVMSLHIQDGQAAVDALAAQDEVDPDRIGCIGNSYGGRTTMWITAYEPRIRACVPSGCMNNFRERSRGLGACGIQYLPGMLRYGDVPEVFSLIAPRPMQLQAGEKDKLLNVPDRDAMAATVKTAYKHAGAPENLEVYIHPGFHILKWKPAKAFLEKHLGKVR